jgi:hypothetical protein
MMIIRAALRRGSLQAGSLMANGSVFNMISIDNANAINSD